MKILHRYEDKLVLKMKHRKVTPSKHCGKNMDTLMLIRMLAQERSLLDTIDGIGPRRSWYLFIYSTHGCCISTVAKEGQLSGASISAIREISWERGCGKKGAVVPVLARC